VRNGSRREPFIPYSFPACRFRVLVNFDRRACQGIRFAAQHILLRQPHARARKICNARLRERLATRWRVELYQDPLSNSLAPA